MTDERPGFATEQVHGGFLPDTAHGARVPAIHMSSGFLFEDAAQARDRAGGADVLAAEDLDRIPFPRER